MPPADPVQYPTVTIGDQQLQVRFRCGDAIRLLSEHNLDLFALPADQMRGVAGVQIVLKLLQAGIAHQKSVTLQELADQLDLSEIRLIDQAIGEAIKKAFPALANPTQPAPAVQ